MGPQSPPTLVELPREGWAEYLDLLSADHAGGVANVRARTRGDEDSGARATFRPLRNIRYDARRRELEVAVGADALSAPLRCFIAEPVRILAGESTAGHVVLVVDRAGTHTSITVRRAAAIPIGERPSLAQAG
ncbi:MAG TPA: DUF5335 family protein [Solirubrobacteraceae bacterium]|jgi:hypothetical protein|nr:DUF5335 family protein [Solirubrobacteraceae bacterium]